ncbi:MAG: heme-dependent peroxidase [Alicyclobacillus sp.]|nr:heme-dependent peroxidase [Alicyclobacillus sp.]
MHEAVETLEGWYVFHEMRRINWPAWRAIGAQARAEAIAELLTALRSFDEVEQARAGSFGQYQMAGHKADLMWIHLRPTLEGLHEAKAKLQRTRFCDYANPVYSYVSVVELSGYLAKPGVDPATDPYLQSRLYPVLPKTRNVCFYPMNKRRLGDDNWYMLSMEQRRELMKSHGLIGRKYHGRVTQIISGSVGLDDWEWGVTLYADDPIQFKKLVYEMRFDEASARFGEFGPFYVGSRLSAADLAAWLTL